MKDVFIVQDQHKKILGVFATNDLAKKSIEFSWHKSPHKVTYFNGPLGENARCPNGEILTIIPYPLFDTVEHL